MARDRHTGRLNDGRTQGPAYHMPR